MTYKKLSVYFLKVKNKQDFIRKLKMSISPVNLNYKSNYIQNKNTAASKINFKGNFTVILKESGSKQCTYKIDKKLYETLKKCLESFRSVKTQPKKIRCLETGRIFDSANDASNWLRETHNIFGNPISIKQACKGKQDTSGGYHWKFVETN